MLQKCYRSDLLRLRLRSDPSASGACLETHTDAVIKRRDVQKLRSVSVCISPLFCEDKATTRAGSISQGKPAADDSSYTFMATWEPTKTRRENMLKLTPHQVKRLFYVYVSLKCVSPSCLSLWECDP